MFSVGLATLYNPPFYRILIILMMYLVQAKFVCPKNCPSVPSKVIHNVDMIRINFLKSSQ